MRMHVTVFGASGSVGRHLVDQALADGHGVTAFTRHARNIRHTNPNLRIVEGDVLSRDAVTRAIDGSDAVFCTLGGPLLSKDRLLSKGTAVIVEAMSDAGLRRLVLLSALGANESRSLLPFRYRRILLPTVMRRLYADHEAQEARVTESDLDWTIARPGAFTKGRRTGAYRHGFTARDRALSFKIARADVADFMLRQLDDNGYLHRAVALSY